MKPVLHRNTKMKGSNFSMAKSLTCSYFRYTRIAFAATHKVLDFLHAEHRIRFVQRTNSAQPINRLTKESNVYVTPEQIQAANKANVETFLAVANAQFAALEKLASLNAGAV